MSRSVVRLFCSNFIFLSIALFFSFASDENIFLKNLHAQTVDLKNDQNRPIYHFQPSADWMNDPKLFFWNGEYHVFFQYSPAPDWGLRHWGHVVSTDLVHWKWLPVALTPTPGGPDKNGCWTGCVIRGDSLFQIIYTGVHPQVQCLASSKDLITWEKYAGNPLNIKKPDGFGDCFRDPCAWKEGDTWYVIIGSEIPDKGGAALLYTSKDLIDWEYMHPLFVGDIKDSGRMFECPDFFPLGNKYVLLTSSGKTHWYIGTYADHKFTAEKSGITDGGYYYAAKTLKDDKGRRIIWGWIREARPDSIQKKAGWSGALSLPRILRILPDNTLGIEPVPELESLRGRNQHYENIVVPVKQDTAIIRLQGIQSDAFEVIIKFAPTTAQVYGAVVRYSTYSKEGLKIGYDRTKKQFGSALLDLRDDEDITLRIFVDHSVIEAFANGRACQTLRTYPQSDDCLGVGVFAYGGEVKVKSVDVWEMKGIK